MSKMRVVIVLEFDNVKPGSLADEHIVNEVTDECERIRIGFDATECWLDGVKFID